MEGKLTIEKSLDLIDSEAREKNIKSELAVLRFRKKLLEEEIDKRNKLLQNEKEFQCEIEGHINLSEEKQNIDSYCGSPYGSHYRVCGRCGALVYNKEEIQFCKNKKNDL